jgi:hypothetical protein
LFLSKCHAREVSVFLFLFQLIPLRSFSGPRSRGGAKGARARRRGGRGGAEGEEARRARGGAEGTRRRGRGGISHRIASHRRVVSRAPLARHLRVTCAPRMHAPTPLTAMMTTTRRDDDTAATPYVAVAAVYHVGGVGVT